MEVGKAIYYLLKDSDAVGAIAGDRIYPEIAQQDAPTPFVAYSVSSTTPSGVKSNSSELDTARVELYVVGSDYAETMDLAIACRSALDRQGGSIGPIANPVQVQSIDFEGSDTDHDPTQDVYIVEHIYNVRVQRTGVISGYNVIPANAIAVREVDGTPSGNVTALRFSNGTLTIDDDTATIDNSGAGSSWEGLSYRTSAQYLSGNASAIDFTRVTPSAIPLDELIFDAAPSIGSSQSGDQFEAGVTGYYRLSVSAVFTSTAQRITPIVEFQINGTAVEGQAYGYIRSSNGQNEASCNLARLLKLSATDTIRAVAYDSSNASGSVYLTQCVIDIERMA